MMETVRCVKRPQRTGDGVSPVPSRDSRKSLRSFIPEACAREHAARVGDDGIPRYGSMYRHNYARTM